MASAQTSKKAAHAVSAGTNNMEQNSSKISQLVNLLDQVGSLYVSLIVNAMGYKNLSSTKAFRHNIDLSRLNWPIAAFQFLTTQAIKHGAGLLHIVK